MKKMIASLITTAVLLTGCAGIEESMTTQPTVVTTLAPADTTAPQDTTQPTVSVTEPVQITTPVNTEEPVSAGSAMVRVFPTGNSFENLVASWQPTEEGTLPLKQVTSAQELAQLVESLGYDQLRNAVGTYDERFFAVHDLVLIPIASTSGMTQFTETTTVQGDQVVIQVEPVAQEPGTAVTQDMMSAFLLLGVPKSDTENRTVVVTGHTGVTGRTNVQAY